MADDQLTPALRRLLTQHPPTDSERLWDEATEAAWRLPSNRAEGPPPGERMARLREQLKGELVAFHKQLRVTPYTGGGLSSAPGWRLWQVDIPLTLFPKRDQGFSRVECLVEFLAADGQARVLRVLKLMPEERSVVQARAELGGSLQVEANAKLGVRLPVPGLTLSDEVASRLYGQAQVGPLIYEARRMCVETEILEGTAARWRLQHDAASPFRIGAESHQLAVVLEVKQGAPPIDAAGCLEAYSDVHWLTQTVGGFWQNLGATLRNFFKRGAPVSAYAEWPNLFAPEAPRTTSGEAWALSTA